MDGMGVDEPRVRRFALAGLGGETAALEFGAADRPIDILFCHANGFNARTYRSILAPLAAEFRLLAIDLRGHGASTLPAVVEGRKSWIDFRDDLLALLEVLDQPPMVLAGHSMGGTTCLFTAAAAPERVRSLVLFDPVIMPPEMLTPEAAAQMHDSPLAQGARRRRAVFASREAAYAAYHGRGAFKTWSDAQLADYVAAGFRDRADGEVELTCAPAWEASNFSSHGHDPWPAFAQVPAPIRMFRAQEGSTARIDGRIGELEAKGVRVETVPGTTHFLPMERPELVRAALREAALA